MTEGPRPAVDGRRLSFRDIMAAADLPTVEHPIPEWGGSVLIRGCTVADLEHIADTAVVVNTKGEQEMARPAYNRALVRYCVIDPVRSAAEVNTIFAEKAGLVVKALIDAINELNGETTRAQAKADPTADDAAQNAAEAAFRAGTEPGAAVRPGLQAGPDGGAAEA